MRYWRYIFVPLVLLLILVGWYTIFSLSQAQLTVGTLPSAALPQALATAPVLKTN